MLTISNPHQTRDATSLYQQAEWLAWFTIAYNILEGLVSLALGVSDEALTLAGFGADSFIEVASGLGILVMLRRIRSRPASAPTTAEQQALRVTGYGFHGLVAILLLGAGLSVWQQHRPETTLPGVVISLLSIAIMWWLVARKTSVGRALDSAAILADAACTKVCIWMSVVLLASSALYELTSIAYADALGAVALAYFCWREGREALEKARTGAVTCGCGTH